jgi:hypothetical protein
LKLEYDETLSNFALKFNLRRYITATHLGRQPPDVPMPVSYHGTRGWKGHLECMQATDEAAAAGSVVKNAGSLSTHGAALTSMRKGATLVGRCRLTVSNPTLKAPMVSALETII